MTKGKTAPKGQKSIASFFGGGKKDAKDTEPEDEEMDVDDDTKKVTKSDMKDEDMDSDDDAPIVKSKAKRKPKVTIVEDDEDMDSDDAPITKSKAKRKPKVTIVEDDEDMDSDDAPVTKSKPKRKPKVTIVEDDEDMDSDDAPITRKKTKSTPPDTSNLPPINQVPAMFADLVGKIEEIKDVAEHIRGRKLRVATMCSGTESPLLALDLICNAVSEKYGVPLEVEHVFSCEIEPFKQAYIERNFHPPLLFRDVCELGDKEATTAYGALATVPGDVDLLVAGTSCVDYSNLNNEKQDINAGGESGRTFHGMMSWVKNHRPPIVILENVCSAPWDKIVDYFGDNGYSATHVRVDTKQYYIPHTRTRGYLVAVNKKNSTIPDQWKKCLNEKLKRPASSTLDAFLLPSDDPRIHISRQKLVKESFNALDRRTGRTDWGRCESRHQRARLDEGLGGKRPLTNWDDGGFCKMPDFAWGDWAVGQVERVWDLMDITVLRAAKTGVDPSYKTQVWNLSQNVDRTIGSSRTGICPCLTPSMIPYITNRGGPMVGLEALSMQGLPIDELLLTRETEDQLADLAGNAMSTTVVGASILAALISARKLLKTGTDTESYEEKKGLERVSEVETDAMDVDQPAVLPVESHITGESELVQRPLDLSVTTVASLPELLEDAEKSSRLCECEGRKDITSRKLNRCVDCGTSSCVKCGGRPEHNPEPIDVVKNPRLAPATFMKELKSTLPMCLSLFGITQELLDGLKANAGVTITEKRWRGWCAAVLRAAELELRFVEPKRQEIWSAVYQSPTACLELLLHPKQPEWRLYGKAEETEPANSEIRHLLESPIARFTCTSTGLLEGIWEFALPFTTEVSITIEGVGEQVPAWEARLGLIGDEYKDLSVHSQLKITLPVDEVPKFDRDISGVYTLLDKCGTANSALHKKVQTTGDASLPPLFMLLDPTRCGEAENDCFVFSISKRRYEFGETRPIICHLDHTWRQSSKEGAQELSCYLPCKWVKADVARLQASHGQDAQYSVPGEALHIAASDVACANAQALLVCSVPIRSQAGPEWPRGEWAEVDRVHERSTFKSLAWLTERIRNVDGHFNSWQNVEMPAELSNCERCAPSAPTIAWTKSKNKMVAIENSVEAGAYERSLKRRPSPFITQLKLDNDGLGTVRIGLNIPSLLHRAMSRLPSKNRTEPISLSWRLDTDYTPAAKLSLPKFVLSSNKNDVEHAQPPHFKVDLRIEQLRSLTWMLEREAIDAPPFIEEEVSEAMLDPLGWRAEGRAQRPVHVRGGVLADQVGYGKTAITLALIDCTAKKVAAELAEQPPLPGKIRTKATLCIVPPHLTLQWAKESEKFMGKRYKAVVISTAAKLNALTIEDIQEADLVIVASNLYRSNVYLENFEALAASGALPTQDGRYFDSCVDDALKGLAGQVDRLRDKGSVAVMGEIKEARKREAEAAANGFVQTKRLKGKSYRDAGASKTVAPVKAEQPASTKPKIPSPSGLVMEVVIPSRRASSSSAPPTSVPPSPTFTPVVSSAAEDEDDSDAPRVIKRRTAIKKPIIISDEEAPAVSKKKPIAAKKGRANGRSKAKASKSASSDYEDESAEETASESESESGSASVEASSSAADEPKGKSKAKAKAPLKKKAPTKISKKAKAAASTEGSDDMDVDEPVTKTAGKKRKAQEDGKQPAKKLKQRREENDPWKLETSTVKRDWTQMHAPPMEMFHFARIVVDEYTYLDGKTHSMVTRQNGDRRWVLSGTPPIHDFGALKTISAYLDVHLGIDDEAEGKSAQVKKRNREQTAVEKFHSFREVHGYEWHANRHKLGQEFLNAFVRQNIAEIDEIPTEFIPVEVNLPAAERAIYLELEHFLRALEMTIKRGNKKTESDREKRVAKSLGESSTAEEALLKRCSHFDLDTAHDDNAIKQCDFIVKDRQQQLDDCIEDLSKQLLVANKMQKKIKISEETMFQEYVRVCRGEGVGDTEASKMVEKLIDDAGIAASKLAHSKTNDAKKGKGKDDSELSKETKDLIWDLREKTHDLRRITKELVGRVRSLRYFTVVRDLQKHLEKPFEVSCPTCERDNIPIEEVAVLSSCGHTGCLTCVNACADNEECVYAASGTCKAAARILNVIKGDTLGVDDAVSNSKGRHFGMKLEMMIKLIKKDIPKDERILIFIQFPDLMKKVAEALNANKIAFLEIRGTATQKSKNLEKFQDNSAERVLLLNVMDESASGANLTSANHAIFLSPLLAPSQEIYDACETQAVGRLRRYGQTKNVKVYRYLTKNTIDEEIYEQRTKVQEKNEDA